MENFVVFQSLYANRGYACRAPYNIFAIVFFKYFSNYYFYIKINIIFAIFLTIYSLAKTIKSGII